MMPRTHPEGAELYTEGHLPTSAEWAEDGKRPKGS